MAGSDSRDLTRAEQSYVAQVTYQFRHLPKQQQHHLLQNVRRALLNSAPYDGYARLEKELGAPASYADRLLGRGTSHDTVAEVPPQKSGWRKRRTAGA